MSRATAILLLVLIACAPALAQDERTHLFIRDSGVAELRPLAEAAWTPIIASRFISSRCDVRTLEKSKAHLQFFITQHDVARVAMLENVELRVEQLELDRDVRTVTLSQKNGRIWVDAQVGKGVKQHFSVQTPSATIAVRGTRFYSEVGADGTTRAGCAEGRVDVTGSGKTVTLHEGEFTTVRPNAVPDRPTWDTQEFGPKPTRPTNWNIDISPIWIPRRGPYRPPGRPGGGTTVPPPSTPPTTRPPAPTPPPTRPPAPTRQPTPAPPTVPPPSPNPGGDSPLQ